MQTQTREADRLQKVVAKTIAISPAGVNLLLIGGFRYRLLDDSQRFSVDIDYHLEGDLEAKQQELLRLCRRTVLGQIRRELGYDGSASLRKGPDAESANAKFVDLYFWKSDTRIEIPLALIRILCLDPSIVRTAGGTVYGTASEADLIESKIIAVLNRVFIQHRDLLDIFLYGDRLRPDSPARLKEKIAAMPISPEAVARRLQDLEANRKYHAAAVQKVIDEQMELAAAQQLTAGGGGRAVLDLALERLKRACA